MHTNIYKIYARYTGFTRYTGGGQAAAARPGPEARVPPPGRRLVFCTYLVHLVYICIYLYVFQYVLIYFDIFGISVVWRFEPEPLNL